jgi:hypothetical protein
LPPAPVLTIEIEQELDGRWLAEVPIVPGALAPESTRVTALPLLHRTSDIDGEQQ